MELSDLDFEALAEQVSQGNVSGYLDSENESGQWQRISWELKAEKFNL